MPRDVDELRMLQLKSSIAYCLLFLLVFAGQAYAQLEHIVLRVDNIPEVRFAFIDAADIDGDGDLDLLLSGEGRNALPVTKILLFEKILIGRSGVPISVVYADLRVLILGVQHGVVRWLDHDKDGDLDIFVSGLSNPLEVGGVAHPTTQIFTNTGSTWVPSHSGQFMQVGHSAADIRDIDGNGYPDIILAGNDGSRVLTKIYLNRGDSFIETKTDLTGFESGSIQWGDFDSDGDFDVLYSGMSGVERLSGVFLNDGNESFQISDFGLSVLYHQRTAWADYDSDGDLDVVSTGAVLSPDLLRGVSTIYRNNGDDLVKLDAPMKGVFAGVSRWGDYEGDGDLDLLLMGTTSAIDPEGQFVYIYLNENNVLSLAQTFRGVDFGTVLWQDQNQDGRLDILMIGYRNGDFTAQMILL